MAQILVNVFNDGGIIPEYQTAQAAGMDLHAKLDSDIQIPAASFRMIPTGIYLQIPEGFEAQVRSRSGLAAKNGLFVLNSPGTIDSDYRGEIKVILFNTTFDTYIVKNSDRIAQMVFAPVIHCNFKSVATKADLEVTIRGEGGFGHTGLKLDR